MLKRPAFTFCCLIVLMTLVFTRVDRTFFKRNASFSERFLYSSLKPRPEWEIPIPAVEELEAIHQIMDQKFTYLAKGAHCFAFVSEDGNYVLKLHKFPSFMRAHYPWINHPFSYYFSQRRKKIKEYSKGKLDYNFHSYVNGYKDLKEETGLVFIHLNQTTALERTVKIEDKTGAIYEIALDDTTFILQRRASMIYPTLDNLMAENNVEQAKQAISHVIELFAKSCQKGYVNNDPILKRNFGLLSDRAIHIDTGDLIQEEGICEKHNLISYVERITANLKTYLEKNHPLLLSHYEQEITLLERTL